MSVNVPSVHQLPEHSKLAGLREMLHASAGLFRVQAAPASLESAQQRVWLFAFLCAAAIVRLWGLGSVGLHGDEETMAMAVRGILAEGWPIIPSGMFYPRGMAQLYLMAGSVAVFGESEWALRLPSVLCGVALVGLAYLAGRRFLRPQWNLAFTACVALLPSLIELSQTARMYIFLVAAVMASMVCVFEWERTERVRWLVGAVAALVVGLDMHVVAVAAILMFMVPGLVRGDLRRLWLGAAAAASVVLAYFLIELWLGTKYPTPPADVVKSFGLDRPLGVGSTRPSLALRELDFAYQAASWAVGLIIGVLAWRVGSLARGAAAIVCASLLLLAGVALQVTLHYHLAILCYLAGSVVALRTGATLQITSRLFVFSGAVIGLGILHAALIAPAAGTVVRTVGALVGQPSVWQYVRIAELSPAAGVLTGLLLAWGVYRLARSERVPDYWLLAILGVWAPLFALGALEWNPPPRYTAMSLAPMLLCAFAFAQEIVDHALDRWRIAVTSARASAVAAVLVAIAAINPPAVASTVTAGYRTHPDHKGAAEFMRSLDLREEDIVMAEDVLQQTYYLGRVDYWVMGPRVAKRFVVRVDGQVVDFYTHTPVIATEAMLDDLLQKNSDKRIFIIGTGEGWTSGRRPVREDLHAALESDRFQTLYVGRDGLTKVLRAVPVKRAPSAQTQAKSEADAAALAEEAEAAPAAPRP